MGFDIVYLPPIHPIGEVNRKGRNNPAEPGGTVNPDPRDVGSPWAIGSKDGGHDAVHPELGTIDDFDEFVAAARERGLEVALDLALQCAPDHPWVTAHPEWFTTRPDGSIAYAENPPKKYQDIYPMNFDNDPAGVYAEVLRVVQYWIDHGVTIFRVDNPHTKPINFWEWLIAKVHEKNPEAIFLAEAFTKPTMMHELARIGFTQSYTYFTWRTYKQETHRLRGRAGRGLGLHAAELLRQHSGHPACLAAVRRSRHVRDPRGAGRDPVADLGRVLRVRTVRARGRQAGQRGVQGLGEVPAAPAGLPGRAHPGQVAGAADHQAERDPPPAPGPAAHERPVVPRHLERQPAVLLAPRRDHAATP